MSEKVLNFPRGSIITMTSGEFSDFRIDGYVVAVKDIDLPALIKEFKAQFVPKNEWDEPQPDAFPSWLVAAGHCMPVDHTEVHLGSYGEFDLGIDTEEEA